VLEGKSDTMHFALGHEDANGLVMMMIERVWPIPRRETTSQVSDKQVEDGY